MLTKDASIANELNECKKSGGDSRRLDFNKHVIASIIRNPYAVPIHYNDSLQHLGIMKFPLSWLKDYINPALPTVEIGHALTMAGLEVDSIQVVKSTPTSVTDTDMDAIFEIGLTPNLGHCACLIGIARELSAVTEKPLIPPAISIKETKGTRVSDCIRVTIEDKDKKGCPRYACRLVKDVVIEPSPEWLQRRLEGCGLRAVNNVVDVVNYVVMELGQPLHAFDYDQLEGHEIIVRSARDGERFTTLDDKERILTAGDLLICDKSKPVAIAGVMGGLNSEVGSTTKNVLLEAAYFHPGTIRKTSKRLGLSTDASKRFERGCDPNQVLQSLDRAAMLLQEIAQGNIAEGFLDVKSGSFPELKVTCRLSRINHVLGTQLSANEIESIFQRLKMPCQYNGQDLFMVTVPTFRVDITAEIDLIEEVARIYGYNNIGSSSARYQASTLGHAPLFLFERELRERLIAEGLQEFVNCDLIGPTISAIVKDNPMPAEAVVHVLNPTSIEQSILRTTLLPGLLQLSKYNYDHQNHCLSGFEIGRIHFKQNDQYKEQSVVGLVMMGNNQPDNWKDKPREVDFYDLKGIIENVLNELCVENVSFKTSAYSTLHTGRQASIFVNELEIGSMGEVHPSILRRLDVPQRIYFAELSLHDLMQVRKIEQKMHPLSIYPCSERDWTITVPEETSLQTLLTIIHAVDSPLLEKVSLLDVYRSEKLGAGLKNLTFHFVYRDNAKTIEQDAADAEHKRIVSQVTLAFSSQSKQNK